MTLQGTPITRMTPRNYTPLAICDATAYRYRDGPELELGYIAGVETLHLSTADARELIAVLLQFIADAEAS